MEQPNEHRLAELKALDAKALRGILKERGVKFWLGLKQDALIAKIVESDVLPATEPAIQAGAAQEQEIEPEVHAGDEEPTTVNVATITPTPIMAATSTETEASEAEDVPTQQDLQEADQTFKEETALVNDGNGQPLAATATYNPVTHIVVNKVRFEALLFNLIRGTLKTYTRQAVPTRLTELLELKGGDNEARELMSGIMQRVMAG